jgi:methyl-accepting chemotaxis protein
MTEENNTGLIGIVGGGKGGLEIFKVLSRHHMSSIKFVVDLDPFAPAVEFARELGVATYSNLDNALTDYQVNIIIEVTGSQKVFEMIRQKVGFEVNIISSRATSLFFSLIEENVGICSEISGILKGINNSLQNIEKSLTAINKVSLDLNMLALNARIEAAHAGDLGKGFAVVADEVKNSSQVVQELAGDIARINEEILSVASGIQGSLSKMS